jgi:histidinol-phosphatase (PHP family)
MLPCEIVSGRWAVVSGAGSRRAGGPAATGESALETANPKLEASRMALPPDLHMHTPLCRHAVGEPVEYARRAVELGITEIGFSDHSPMRRDDFDDWRMRLDQLDEYVENVRKAQKAFPQLTIRLAMEVDYLPGQEEWIRELAARHPWDYFIGSVHYVSESWAIDNPKQLSEWRSRDSWEVWSIYFDWLTKAAETGMFEIIGHADLPKKFGFRPERDCAPLYEKFLDAAKKHDCALDVNTAGLRKDCKEIYPNRQILELAFRKGVPVAFGSDAHAPQEVGMNFKEAVELVRGAGYTECARFGGRKREMVGI